MRNFVENSMNLYSNKQTWKIVLLVFALFGVLFSLYVSNRIVKRVELAEKERAKQWGIAVKKKAELIKLTNSSFEQLKENEFEKMKLWIEATRQVSQLAPLDVTPDYSFPNQIIQNNKNIPVILMDNQYAISAEVNVNLDTQDIVKLFNLKNSNSIIKKIDDSLRSLAFKWRKQNKPFRIEIFEGFYMTYYFTNSKIITQLENNRDSLISAFERDLIDNEGLVPVILVDKLTDSIISSNFKTTKKINLQKEVKKYALVNKPITIDYGQGQQTELYFDNSPELKQLRFFPYAQFAIIGLFVFISYLLFSTFRKAEQNQVWAGMAKETAHQLGTPLSSLMAWVEILKLEDATKEYAFEMEKDVSRLEKVSDRFSKIGSATNLNDQDIHETLKGVLDYLKPRISSKVLITFIADKNRIEAVHNASLMEWVFENLCKNAVDAMESNGKLTVTISNTPEWVHIDIADTGKGIAQNQFKTIFKPGFTTKKRGWGLGLSLVKRIVSEYHGGKVFVLNSAVNQGTTIRVSLRSLSKN